MEEEDITSWISQNAQSVLNLIACCLFFIIIQGDLSKASDSVYFIKMPKKCSAFL